VLASANRFGLIGCILGLIAIGFAALPMWVLPTIFPPPPASSVIADTVVDIKDRLAAKITGATIRPSAPRPPSKLEYWQRVCSIVATVLGLAALAMGVVSALRREQWRYAGIAACLGVGAMVFEILTTAMAFLVVGALVLALLQVVGLGP